MAIAQLPHRRQGLLVAADRVLPTPLVGVHEPEIATRLGLAVAIAQLPHRRQGLLVAADRVLPTPLLGVHDPETATRLRLAVTIMGASGCLEREFMSVLPLVPVSAEPEKGGDGGCESLRGFPVVGGVGLLNGRDHVVSLGLKPAQRPRTGGLGVDVGADDVLHLIEGTKEPVGDGRSFDVPAARARGAEIAVLGCLITVKSLASEQPEQVVEAVAVLGRCLDQLGVDEVVERALCRLGRGVVDGGDDACAEVGADEQGEAAEKPRVLGGQLAVADHEAGADVAVAKLQLVEATAFVFESPGELGHAPCGLLG